MKNLSSHCSPLQNQRQLPNPRTPGSRQEEEKERKEQDDVENHLHEVEDDSEARCEWDFNLATVVSSSSSSSSIGGAASDTLGVIEFDPCDRLLATGGISRKIRIYRTASLLPHEGLSSSYEQVATAALDHANACDFYICTPAKLSSLRWKPGSGGGVLGSADYDGVVMEYDLERRLPVFERDEHGGRRVWSMDYSPSDPVVGASGSDDGTMQVWDPRCEGGECLGVVQPSAGRSPVCCVEFNPFGGCLVAAGCADRRVYGYDVRRMGDPVLVLDGHQRSVTYIRFLDRHTMVTAGIDGCLKTWHTADHRLIRTYTGHVNARRFVGLSVWRGGGLLSCGSEDNQVVVYDKRWGSPVWVKRFEPSSAGAPAPGRAEYSGGEYCEPTGAGFVSSVCWRQMGEDQCTLVAGGSDGVLQVFSGSRRRISQ
ncbi:WD repeat-containing protein RUP2 [Coffea eugenioides]|uniref:WD repeat-containing protein RUP2 n=1 Tax=Coffea eugenioides TaxID=49369 RepID=UPI000F607D60|nr:WD repeat-containing protein RUP2 [Coffea eugenioides]